MPRQRITGYVLKDGFSPSITKPSTVRSNGLMSSSAVVVAIIAAAVSLIGALINVYVSRRSTYLNAVTAERSKWIDKLRTNISTFSGLVRTLYFRLLTDKAFFRTPEYYDLVKEVNGLIPLIKLQLNPAGEIDRHLVGLLDRIPYLAENPQNDMLIRAVETAR